MEKIRRAKKSILGIVRNNKSTVFVIILLFANKFLGFIKNVIMAKYYGTNPISDAYHMATSISTITIGITLYSYQAFTKGFFISQKKNEENEYASSFVNFVLIMSLILLIIILFFSKSIVGLFAPGFDEVQSSYTESLLVPILFGTTITIIINILSEYLRCKKTFVIPQFFPLLLNIVEIAAIYLAVRYNYMWLAYGFLIANAICLVALVILSTRRGFRYKFSLSKRHVNIFKKVFIPVLISSLIVDVNFMVDKMFASSFETGTVSMLSYAINIRSVLLIIAAGILTVLFPKISKISSDNQIEKLQIKIKRILKIILLIYIPLTIIMLIAARPLVGIVYSRGEFGEESVIRTSLYLSMYIIGIAGISVRDLYIKALYCLEKGKYVTFISIASVLINVILNFVLSNIMGPSGLALATSLSAIIATVPLYFYYLRTVHSLSNINDGNKDE